MAVSDCHQNSGQNYLLTLPLWSAGMCDRGCRTGLGGRENWEEGREEGEEIQGKVRGKGGGEDRRGRERG